MTTTHLYRIDSSTRLDASMDDPLIKGRVQLIAADDGLPVIEAAMPWPDLCTRECVTDQLTPSFTLPRDALLLHARLLEVFGDPP